MVRCRRRAAGAAGEPLTWARPRDVGACARQGRGHPEARQVDAHVT
jgi:hypothetical protein